MAQSCPEKAIVAVTPGSATVIPAGRGGRGGEAMLIAHRIALNPNKAQALYLARAAGIARFAFNWALAEWKQQASDWWFSGKLAPFPSDISIRKDFNSIKHTEFPWTGEVSKCVVQEAIIDLGIAFRNFKIKNAHYPRFKSKAKTVPSFCEAEKRETTNSGSCIVMCRFLRFVQTF